MTKRTRNLLETGRYVARLYDVRLSIVNYKDERMGGVLPAVKTVLVCRRALKDPEVFFSVLFHEIGHVFCYRNKIYPAYHRAAEKTRITVAEKRAIIATGWKAERYVDRWAKVEMKRHFPTYDYVAGYVTEADKKWLYDAYLYMFEVKKKGKKHARHK